MRLNSERKKRRDKTRNRKKLENGKIFTDSTEQATAADIHL